MVDLTKKKTLAEYETGALANGDTVVTYRQANAVGEKVFRGDIVAGTAASIADGTSTALKMYSDKALKDSLNTGAIPIGTDTEIETGTDTTAKLYAPDQLNSAINSLIETAVPDGTEAQIIAGTDTTERKFTPADINGAVKDIAVAQYAGRTAMKAATGLTAGDVVYLSEGGRSGPFEYLVGDYSAEVTADTLEGVYVKLDAVASTVGVLKRVNTHILLPQWFGVEMTDLGDYSSEYQACIDLAATMSGFIFSYGKCRAYNLTMPSNVVINGGDIELSAITQPDGVLGNIIESANFDALLASGEADVEDGCHTNFGLKNITIDGNRENAIGTPTATVGWGIRLYGKRMVLDQVRINGVKGSGLHTALGTVSDKTFDYRTESKPGYIRDLRIYAVEYDGWVYNGPSDIPIGDTFIGWPANSLVDTVYDAAKRSLVYPTERPANLVMTGGGAELVGFVHLFGNKHGWGARIGNGTSIFRLKANYIMSETTFGGFLLYEKTRGQIGLLDVHDNDGGDGSQAMFRTESTEPVNISNIEMRRGSDDNGSNSIELAGNRAKLGEVSIIALASAGHGIVDSGSNNHVTFAEINGCQGTAFDGNNSIGYWPKSTASRAGGVFSTVSCTIGSKCGGGASFRGLEITDRSSVTPFDSFHLLSSTERKEISIFDDLNGTRNHCYKKIDGIDGSLTTLQTFLVDHDLLFTPAKSEIQLTAYYTSGVMPDIVRMFVNSVTATQISVSIECAGGAVGVMGIGIEV